MKPLQRAESIPPKWSTWAAHVTQSTGISMEAARKVYEEEFIEGESWMNDHYVVIKKELPNGFTHLSIRRTDRKACRDWRDFQQMKNQLCGDEREGVELYPAESRLVDTANQFHIWVAPPGTHIGCGYFMGRNVSGTDEAAKIPGAVQRDLEEGSG